MRWSSSSATVQLQFQSPNYRTDESILIVFDLFLSCQISVSKASAPATLEALHFSGFNYFQLAGFLQLEGNFDLHFVTGLIHRIIAPKMIEFLVQV